MKSFITRCCSLALIILLPAIGLAQNNEVNITGTQTSCTTGAQGKAGNFIISYTIGEMPLVQTWVSNGLMITQGVNQPYYFVADTMYQCFSQTEVKLFPNPTPGIFSINLRFLQKGQVTTVITDLTGKPLQTAQFDYGTFSTKTFNISGMPNAHYFLQLIFKDQTGHTRRCVYAIQKL
jgi:hypothetical protein